MQNKANILFETAIIGNLSLPPMAGFKNNAPPSRPAGMGINMQNKPNLRVTSPQLQTRIKNAKQTQFDSVSSFKH